MKHVAVLLIAFLGATSAFAADAPAKDASIRELLSLMDMPKMLDGMYSQLDTLMQSAIKPVIEDTKLNAEQQTILEDMGKQMAALFKEELSWKSFEPSIIEIYRNSFSESEVQSMLQFYKSDGGKAVLAKMPIVMQQSMQSSQNITRSFMPKLQKLQQDTAARLKAACKENCSAK